MKFNADTVFDGIREREFLLGDIPGVLWTADDNGTESRPLILIGHGGGQHKRAPGALGRARHFVTAHGFAVAAIDAPGHGERPRTASDEASIAALRASQKAHEPKLEIVADYNKSLAERAVPEWQATLDALQTLPEIGSDGPVGYNGWALGTALGIPLTAADPRIRAAVFHSLAYDWLIEVARRITVPVQYAMQWDDEIVPRELSLALFDAFATDEKSLHASPGHHRKLPRTEVESAGRFLARHLTPVE